MCVNGTGKGLGKLFVVLKVCCCISTCRLIIVYHCIFNLKSVLD